MKKIKQCHTFLRNRQVERLTMQESSTCSKCQYFKMVIKLKVQSFEKINKPKDKSLLNKNQNQIIYSKLYTKIIIHTKSKLSNIYIYIYKLQIKYLLKFRYYVLVFYTFQFLPIPIILFSRRKKNGMKM